MYFNYNIPINVIFGRGRLKEIGAEVAKLGSKVLLVSNGSKIRLSLIKRIKCYIEKEGINSIYYDFKSKINFKTKIEDVINILKKEHCDIIIGVGNSECINFVKTVVFKYSNNGKIDDYIYGIKEINKVIKLIAIPTTCESGNEANGVIDIYDKDNIKQVINSNELVPDLSIIDSECMMTIPKTIIALSGINALSLCIEAYTSNRAQPGTDALCLQGIELLTENLVKLYDGSVDYEVWDSVIWACIIGSIVSGYVGFTLIHEMAKAVKQCCEISEKKAVAALLPKIIEASISYNNEKIMFLDNKLKKSNFLNGSEGIKFMERQLKINYSLSKLGVKEEDIDKIVHEYSKTVKKEVMEYPIKFTEKQIEEIYRKSLKNDDLAM